MGRSPAGAWTEYYVQYMPVKGWGWRPKLTQETNENWRLGGLMVESPRDDSQPARDASFSPPNSPRKHFLGVRERTGDFSTLQ